MVICEYDRELKQRDYSQVRDEYDGKTVVENRPMGLIVGAIDRSVITASDAERSAKAGAPTHAFLYESTSFLFDAVQEYSALGERSVTETLTT